MAGLITVKHRKYISAALFALAAIPGVYAQAIGGNASLSVSSSSARVALPADTRRYSAVLIAPAFGASAEIFYNLGDATVAAVSGTSPALPTGGICVNVGPNVDIAAISASAQTLRITQLNTCPIFSGGTAPAP